MRSRILPIRDVNNWAKDILILKAIQLIQAQGRINVLDLCCGRGGDLTKYQHIKQIQYYAGIDITLASIVEAIERYNKLLKKAKNRKQFFEADFILGDVGQIQLYKHISQIKFDIISCMFALHYMFQTKERAITFFQNVSNLMTRNGRFIAIFPHKDTIMRMIDKSLNKKEIITPLMKIKFENQIQKDEHKYGQAYKFALEEAVLDIDEYLVDTTCLKDVLRICNLEIETQFGSLEELLTSDSTQGLNREVLFQQFTRNAYRFIQLLNGKEIDEEGLQNAEQKYDPEQRYSEGLREFDQIPKEYQDVIRIYNAIIVKHKSQEQYDQKLMQQQYLPNYKTIYDICNLSDEQINYEEIRKEKTKQIGKPFYFALDK